jgi:hypothetical protein
VEPRRQHGAHMLPLCSFPPPVLLLSAPHALLQARCFIKPESSDASSPSNAAQPRVELPVTCGKSVLLINIFDAADEVLHALFCYGFCVAM